jgi:hypothetical protein
MSLVRVPAVLVALAAAVTLSAQQMPPTSPPGPSALPRPPGGVASGPPLVMSFESAMLSAPPEALGLDPFYKKYADAFGIPIVASEKVADAALLMARDIVNYMLLKRPDVRDVMIGRKSRVLIMSINEGEMDLPERRDWKKPAITDPRLTPGERQRYDEPGGIASMTDQQYWNQRARGMGGNVTSAAEENILGIPGTRYFGEHILVHEFSHNIMGALRVAEPGLVKEVEAAYAVAKEKNLYQGQYAINTVAEYWAEGTQWWFWSNIEFYDRTTKTRIQTPDEFKEYDPTLYAILERVYPGHHIPADIYYGKNLKPVRKPE